MRTYKNLSLICLVAIVFYFFFEAFGNVLVNINAFVFMNLSEISIILPSLIISIVLIIFELITFMTPKLKRKYKPYILIYITAGLRLASLFIVAPDIIMILNLIMIFSTLIFFTGIILFMEANESYFNYSLFFGSVIIGLGIQFIFLMVNISSNLTSDPYKIVAIFIFITILILANNYLFYPGKNDRLHSQISGENKKLKQKRISLLHFVILGILFIFSMMWIFNPMTLASYDIQNLSYNGLVSQYSIIWPSYGFTYYILIILITTVISFIIVYKYLIPIDQKLLKITIISSVGITCILNFFAFFVIEKDLTIISSIFISVLTVISVFSVILYIIYVFSFYTFNSPKTLLIGIIIFFLTVLFFVILHVQILWYEYLSLLVNLIIQIITGLVFILIVELRNIRISFELRSRSFAFNKQIGFFFVVIFVLYAISFGSIIQARSTAPIQNPDPTFMTWNIHNAIGVDDAFNLDRLVEQIKERDPDIVGLNEVDMGALKTSFADLPSYFAHRLNMYYFYGYTFYKHYGNVILSKYPIIQAEIIPLPLIIDSAEPRSLIKAKFQISSSIWTVFVTHLSTSTEDRLAQVPYIISEIEKESLFEKIVWMGDFNFEPSSAEYLLINTTTTLNLTDTYPFLNSDLGYTGHFDEDNLPQRRIDYIMCSPDLIPITSSVFCSIASDHCAVITKF